MAPGQRGVADWGIAGQNGHGLAPLFPSRVYNLDDISCDKRASSCLYPHACAGVPRGRLCPAPACRGP